MGVCMCFFFFFSSRRRHTRSDRDWSSDVCSSDLTSSNVMAGSNAAASFTGVLIELVCDYSGKSAARRKGNVSGDWHGRVFHQKILLERYSESFVKNASATMISTDPTTAADVVARPTPCVPPRTVSPL